MNRRCTCEHTDTKFLDMCEHTDTKFLDMCGHTDTKFLDKCGHTDIIFLDISDVGVNSDISLLIYRLEIGYT